MRRRPGRGEHGGCGVDVKLVMWSVAIASADRWCPRRPARVASTRVQTRLQQRAGVAGRKAATLLPLSAGDEVAPPQLSVTAPAATSTASEKVIDSEALLATVAPFAGAVKPRHFVDEQGYGVLVERGAAGTGVA